MWVKICANTNLDDALLAAELGADAIGFVFAPSARRVTAQQVATITPYLPKSAEKVGVFTTTDADEILAAAKEAGLSAVQLHSDFDPDLIDAVVAGSKGTLKVLPVLDIPADVDTAVLREVLTEVLRHWYVFAVLLDASHGGASGGTGKVFDWESTATVVREVQRETGGKVIIAGGLHAENVGAAIAAFAPWGVDVASGVESVPGKKDPERLRAFLKAARDTSHLK
jgi:phosphoribosylanthranilate isomerase